MSLNGALQIGRSALSASQAAIQVAGNNMANAATPGYHRQTVHLSPSHGEVLGRGSQVGTGVQLLAIRREIDAALQARYRDATSQENRDLIDQRFLTTIETLPNELSDNDLSSLLSTFFNSFSELANSPNDNAVRSVVIEQGRNLASRVASLRGDYNTVLDEVDRSLHGATTKVNDILNRIALVNGQIAQAEGVGGQANSLRDQRDILIDDLSQYIDVTAIEQSNGSVDLLVGSLPILLGGQSRGIELRTEPGANGTDISVRVAADGSTLTVTGGQIGGLLNQRNGTVRPVIDDLDTFAGQLIFQINRIHSQGQARTGYTSVAGTYAVDDTTTNLNASATGLPFTIGNGSFFIHVTHSGTGLRTTHQINVNGNAMSLDDLVNQINNVVGVPNVTASVNADREFQLDSSAAFQISFSDDSSGALAALGINTFFTGTRASDIDVNHLLIDDPNRLAAASGHVDGSNDTALAIADLQNLRLSDLGGRSLREYWQHSVNGLAVKAAGATAAAESSRLVRESLGAQVQAVSGVSLDEESINLLTFQRQFQAAARFINVIDEALRTLLSIA
jgi:flagellar hook-associated protein 1 FlgK